MTRMIYQRSLINKHRSRSMNGNPKIIVKKEPPSPSIGANPRHRPRKLDLNTSTHVTAPLSSRPSAGGASVQEIGLACLSPGFQTQDPTMREQLQRSISVRDQQRSIIESRLLKTAKGDGRDSHEGPRNGEVSPFGQGSNPNSKKRPPPGLSIVPPPAEHFANERVIQSAPLGQTFTGRHNPHPQVRQPQDTNPMSGSQIHHVPAVQTNNRLPPISDVFGNETLQPMSGRPPFLHTNSTPSQTHGPPLPSPGFPPQTAHPMSQPTQPSFDRPREYRSAEEAVHEMTGGREELQPKLIRYGRQPPTPPSPNPHRSDHLTPHKYQPAPPESGAGRRRSRNEYEADSSPPLGTQPHRTANFGPFGAGRDSPATQQAKKEEFLSLMSRAWDLFHS